MNFDHIIKSKIEGYEVPADASLWNKVEKGLKSNDSGFQSGIIGGIATSVLFFAVLASNPNPVETEINIDKNYTTSSSNHNSNNYDRSTSEDKIYVPQDIHDIQLAATSDNTNSRHQPLGINKPRLAQTMEYGRSSAENIIEKTLPDKNEYFESVHFTAAGIECEGYDIVFTAQGLLSNETPMWVFDGLKVVEGKKITINFEEPGIHEVRMIVDRREDKIKVSKFITVYELPSLSYEWKSEQNDKCIKQDVNLSAASGENTYKWIVDEDTVGRGQFNTVKLNPGFHFLTVQATNSHGCQSVASSNIQVPDGFLMFQPSSFSPNNDGENDEWVPVGLEESSSFEITIVRMFDNKEVFKSNVIKGWDGSILGTAERAHSGEWFLARIILTDYCGETKEISSPIITK